MLFNTKYEFWFLKGSMIIYKLQLSLLTPRGDNSMEKVMVVACMYTASRIVAKPIKCVCSTMRDLAGALCAGVKPDISTTSSPQYMDNAIIENIEVCFI